MLATALLLRDVESVNTRLAPVFVSLWFASYMLISGTFRSRKP